MTLTSFVFLSFSALSAVCCGDGRRTAYQIRLDAGQVGRITHGAGCREHRPGEHSSAQHKPTAYTNRVGEEHDLRECGAGDRRREGERGRRRERRCRPLRQPRRHLGAAGTQPGHPARSSARTLSVPSSLNLSFVWVSAAPARAQVASSAPRSASPLWVLAPIMPWNFVSAAPELCHVVRRERRPRPAGGENTVTTAVNLLYELQEL